MIEQTLCIIKPDAALTAAPLIMINLLAADFTIIRLHRAPLTRAQAERLYDAHIGQAYYDGNLNFMLSGPTVAMVLEAEDACRRLRERIGATDPTKAACGTLRRLYGTALPRNAIHASESALAAAREIGIFFPTAQPPSYNTMPWGK